MIFDFYFFFCLRTLGSFFFIFSVVARRSKKTAIRLRRVFLRHFSWYVASPTFQCRWVRGCIPLLASSLRVLRSTHVSLPSSRVRRSAVGCRSASHSTFVCGNPGVQSGCPPATTSCGIYGEVRVGSRLREETRGDGIVATCGQEAAEWRTERLQTLGERPTKTSRFCFLFFFFFSSLGLAIYIVVYIGSF